MNPFSLSYLLSLLMPRNIPYALYARGSTSKPLNEPRGEKRPEPEVPPDGGVTPPPSPKVARSTPFAQIALICLILGAVLFGLAWRVPGL